MIDHEKARDILWSQVRADLRELKRLAKLGDAGDDEARSEFLSLAGSHEVRMAFIRSLGPEFPRPDLDENLDNEEAG